MIARHPRRRRIARDCLEIIGSSSYQLGRQRHVAARRRLRYRRAWTPKASTAWMTVEAAVAIAAAFMAGSVALLGFGLDSLIELASASTILRLYTGRRARQRMLAT